VPLVVTAVGKTDLGLVRTGNEDFIHIDQANQVYAVCDGMGGHQAGEVAAMTAAEIILKAFTTYAQPLLSDSGLTIGRSLPPTGDLLLRSTRLANRAIHNMAQKDPNLSGMGTTIVAVALEGDNMSVVHVGDSRAYRLLKKSLEPLTVDHSWVAEIQKAHEITDEEANSMVGRNVITRALGVKENVEADYRLIKVAPGDQFILCSDGLCGFADDDEIFEVATDARDDLKKLTTELVRMANDRGGSDNVSVLAIEIVEVAKTPLPEVELFTLSAEDAATSELEDKWLEKLAALKASDGGEAKPGSGPRSLSKVWLLAIFAIFVIVAALLVLTQAD